MSDASDVPPTIFGGIADQAKEKPHAVAIQTEERPPLTYARLHNHLLSVVTALNRIGVGRNDRVAIVLPQSAEMATACLGVAAGAVAVPLSPEYRAPEYDAYLGSLRPRLLLTEAGRDSPARTAALALGVPVMELSQRDGDEAGLFDLRTDARPGAPRAGGLAQPQDEALVLHTSGTT